MKARTAGEALDEAKVAASKAETALASAVAWIKHETRRDEIIKAAVAYAEACEEVGKRSILASLVWCVHCARNECTARAEYMNPERAHLCASWKPVILPPDAEGEPSETIDAVFPEKIYCESCQYYLCDNICNRWPERVERGRFWHACGAFRPRVPAVAHRAADTLVYKARRDGGQWHADLEPRHGSTCYDYLATIFDHIVYELQLDNRATRDGTRVVVTVEIPAEVDRAVRPGHDGDTDGKAR